jgi:GT2 family glycosyltransferase
MPTDTPHISALIVNWNTRDDLARCLASLSPAVPARETVVVDNDSADGSAEMVAEQFPGVTLLKMGENLGYAEGNNLAAECARGDFLLFLNPDTVVPPDAPARLARFLEERPAAALVAPKLILPDGSVQASVRGMPTPTALFGAWSRLDAAMPRHPVWSAYRLPSFDYDETQPAPQPMASAWMVRRAAWQDVGPFDPRFPLYFNDVDWCLRAHEKGWETWYLSDVAVQHRHGASTRQIRGAAVRESHRALVAFYRKHYARRLGPMAMAGATAAIRAVGALRGLHPSARKRP